MALERSAICEWLVLMSLGEICNPKGLEYLLAAKDLDEERATYRCCYLAELLIEQQLFHLHYRLLDPIYKTYPQYAEQIYEEIARLWRWLEQFPEYDVD